MSVYLLFAGARYYPSGGAEDLIGVYPSEEAAQAVLGEPDEYGHYRIGWEQLDWMQIVRVDEVGAYVLTGWSTNLGSDERYDLTGRIWTLSAAPGPPADAGRRGAREEVE